MASLSYSIFNAFSGTDSNAPSTTGVTNPSGTVYSKIWSGHHADGHGLTVQWSGTLSGTFTMWMTDKPNPSEADDTDWVQDTSFSPTNPAGSAGKFRDDVWNGKATNKRLKYVHSSGSGTLLGWVSTPRTA